MRDHKTCNHARLQSGIYEIRHVESGRVYVGSALCIPCRWRLHLHYLKQGKHHSSYLQRAWVKYGEDAFVFSVLEECAPKQLTEREQHWIDSTDCLDRAKGFNRAPRAGSQLGFRHSEESLQRMRLKKISEEQRELLRRINTGKKQSETTIQKRMQNTPRRKLTDAQIREIQQRYEDSCHTITQTQLAREYGVDPKTISCVVRRKGRTYQTDIPLSNYPTRVGNRHPHTEEQRRRSSEARKGKPSPTKGRPLTEEHKQKLREARRRRAISTQPVDHNTITIKGDSHEQD